VAQSTTTRVAKKEDCNGLMDGVSQNPKGNSLVVSAICKRKCGLVCLSSVQFKRPGGELSCENARWKVVEIALPPRQKSRSTQ
jgi:hypothetical protein